MLDVTSFGGITTLRLDHGKVHALDLELLRALDDGLRAFEQDAEARAAILTGTGTVFSAGVDLYRLLDGGPEYAREYVPVLSDTLRHLFAASKPVVAAINGHAIAGGCVLAEACDYRLMADGDGTIGVPELRVGIPFPLVAIEILRFATSTAHLQELVYRGTTYLSTQARDRGLVDEVVPAGKLMVRAVAVAERLASEPTGRFRVTKRQLRAPVLASIAAHDHETMTDVVSEWERPESLAAIRAYLAARRSGG